MKERGKIYAGQLVAVGNKEEIQQKLNFILAESSQKQAPQPMSSTTAERTGTVESTPEATQEKGTSYFTVKHNIHINDWHRSSSSEG